MNSVWGANLKRFDIITSEIVAVLGNAGSARRLRAIAQLATAIIECERLERDTVKGADDNRSAVKAGGMPDHDLAERFIAAIKQASVLGQRLGLDWSHETGAGDVPVTRNFEILNSRKATLQSSCSFTAHLAAMAPIFERWDKDDIKDLEHDAYSEILLRLPDPHCGGR